MGRQSSPIFAFWPIFPYKTPQKYLPVTSLQPRKLSINTRSSDYSERSKEVPFASKVLLRRLVGELGTAKVAQISPMGNVCVYIGLWLAVWLSGNALASINVVALRQTRLVLGWVTVCGRVNHFGM